VNNTAHADRRGATRAVLVVVCLALATVVSAVASLNVAIPSIARGTHATQTQLSWIIDAYSLVFASVLLLGGSLGDRYGRRRTLLAGLVVFGAGSAAAMTASDPSWLIALRGCLGLGAALVMPATLSTITATFPAEERPRAVGTWAGVAGAGAIVGVLFSGVVPEFWSWRAVFALNVVLAAVAAIGTLRLIPESADRDAPRIDYAGAVITVVGLGILAYSIIEAPTRGWTDAATIAGIAAGLAVLAGFVLWELRRANPLLDPRLFADRAFCAGTLSIAVQFFAFFGFVFLMLQYMQIVRGESPLVAALGLLPIGGSMMPCSRVLAPRLAVRAGQLKTCVLGLVLLAAGLIVLSRLDESSPYLLLLAGLLPLGAGMGLAMTPATGAITDALPAAKQGVGSAMNDLARELGGALGIAVLGSLLQSEYRSNLDPVALPPALAQQARSSVALATQLGGPVADQARHAFTLGMRSALLGAAILVALGALGVARLLKGHQGHRPTAASEQDADIEVSAA
jgi:EmrB/QacA subfamily drug resistance transporter